mmetsp:Transcript_22018/g.49675  ORF Transcript_22018/g.49675 Transcript_22018/m.49675 type:complete len:219 (-) Transcript_22018:622-1278(-)
MRLTLILSEWKRRNSLKSTLPSELMSACLNLSKASLSPNAFASCSIKLTARSNWLKSSTVRRPSRFESTSQKQLAANSRSSSVISSTSRFHVAFELSCAMYASSCRIENASCLPTCLPSSSAPSGSSTVAPWRTSLPPIWLDVSPAPASCEAVCAVADAWIPLSPCSFACAWTSALITPRPIEEVHKPPPPAVGAVSVADVEVVAAMAMSGNAESGDE